MHIRLDVLLPTLCLIVCASCGKTSAEWEAELSARDPFVAGMAAIGLALQDPAGAQNAIPVLLETIDRSEVGLEPEAAEALYRAGPHHVEFLLQQIVDDELMSVDRLGTIKNTLVGAGPEVAEPIVRCLAGPGRQRAGDLGEMLIAIGEPSVRSLVTLLDGDADSKLKNYAAFLLGNLGAYARAALPSLQRASESEDPELRAAVQRAIQQIQSRTPSRGR